MSRTRVKPKLWRHWNGATIHGALLSHRDHELFIPATTFRHVADLLHDLADAHEQENA